jgi:hypothetical protein
MGCMGHHVLAFNAAFLLTPAIVNCIISRIKPCTQHDRMCKAILLLLCASIAFSSSLREAGVGLGVKPDVAGSSASPVEAPLEEAPVPSEPPTESTHSEELPQGEEAGRLRAAHLSPRGRSRSKHEYLVEQLYASGVRIAHRIVHSQSEHHFRNGCGAPLRC